MEAQRWCVRADRLRRGCGILLCTFMLGGTAGCDPSAIYAARAKEFLARAEEVQPVIKAVYQHQRNSGDWPQSLQELKATEDLEIPADWEYLLTSDEASGTAAILRVRGPMHMKLEYRFRDQGTLAAPGGWIATMEGDPIAHNLRESLP